MYYQEIFGRMKDLVTRRPVRVDGEGRVVVRDADLHIVTAEYDLAAASDYDANDVMTRSKGDSWHFTNVVENNGGTGYITQVNVLCETTALTPRLTLYLFNAVPTCALADREPNTAVLSADRYIYQGKIDLPALEDLGTGLSESIATISTTGNLPLSFKCADNNTALYGVIVTRDSISGEAAGMYLRIKLTIERR